jgi:hypothetical protein
LFEVVAFERVRRKRSEVTRFVTVGIVSVLLHAFEGQALLNLVRIVDA